MNKFKFISVFFFAMLLLAPMVYGAANLQRNPPECDRNSEDCGCDNGAEVAAACIKVNLDLGETTPWTGSMQCALKVFADSDSPNVFSQLSLYTVLGGYTFKRLGPKNLSDGLTPAEVVLAHPNGEPVHFVFKDGESIARPDPGVHIKMDERLMMVDAQGWATTKEPVYYDLYVGDGSRRRFLATNMTGALGELVSITTPRGVTMTPDDMGVHIVYDSNGVRQFLTPSRLADVTPFPEFKGYEVKVYPIQDKPLKDSATGLYIPPQTTPVKHLKIVPENGWQRAIVTLKSGDNDPKRYVFNYAFNDWSLTHASGREERKERDVLDSVAAYIKNETVAADGKVLSRKVKNYKYESWGYAMTNRVEGFGGVTDTTSWTYYTSGNGKGQVKTEKRQSGLLIEYAYDSADRVISEKRSGPDMMTEVTTYDYTPVDPSDPALPVDTRPRIIVKTLNGIECERTYYVYAPLTNIVERVGTQGAAYGGTNVLRTVTAFNPVTGGPLSSAAADGRVASVRHEDGKLDLYDYALNDGIWTETVTHLHEQSPEPVSGKTTRDITLTNARGEVTETRTEAFIENVWHTIASERLTYNAEGKRIKSENLAGQITTTAWDCCHKISEVQPDGSTTMWDYDEEGRMVASSRLIPLDMTNVTWLTTCYEYDDLGRQIAIWQTNRSAKVGLPVTRTRYDALGRVVARVDQLGNTTTTSYSSDGRTVFVEHPNSSTTVIVNSSDGKVLSITGSAGTPVFHSSGLTQTGLRWSRDVQGETEESSRFKKQYVNMLGQRVCEERSGFRGVGLSSVHVFDSYGRLIRSVVDGEPTVVFLYDLCGNLIANIRTSISNVTDQGSLEWRKIEFGNRFVQKDSCVWLLGTNVLSCSDFSIEPLVSSSARQLTGCSADIPLRAHYIDVRSNVTEKVISHNDSIVAFSTRVSYASNTSQAFLRYGFPVMDVYSSCVTNTYVYDSLGRRVAFINGRGNTYSVDYNEFGQVSFFIDSLGNRTSYGYDRIGNLITETNALGNAIFYEYNLRGQKTLSYGTIYPMRCTYDIFGNMTSMTTFRKAGANAPMVEGDTTFWQYDEASGVVTNKVSADGKGVIYNYSDDVKLVRRIWARGVTTEYSYNGWNSLRQVAYSDDTPTVSLIYDVLGRWRGLQDAAGSTMFNYDSFGSLTNETVVSVDGITSVLERFFDRFGRQTGYAIDSIQQISVAYESASGRIMSMLFGSDDSSFTWSYLSNSTLKSSLAYPNGIQAIWRYDAKDQLLQVRNTYLTNVISQYDYVYDAVGRRIQIARSGSAMSENRVDEYGYNVRNELIFAANRGESSSPTTEYAYQYDDIGNRISSYDLGMTRTYIANNLNQYTSISNSAISLSSVGTTMSQKLGEKTVTMSGEGEGFIPQFDDDGNQTIVRTTTGDWQVEYNGENRPVSWVCGETNIVMSYDIMGRRIQCVEIISSLTNSIDNFIYDGYQLISRRHIAADGAMTINRFIWDVTEPIATRPLVIYGEDNNPQYYSHDGNKNVSELISSKSSVLAHYEYAPFGMMNVVLGDFELETRNPFTFSSEYADDAIGLMYYNHRSYNPHDGRWLSKDPYVESPDVNGYIMCRNSLIDLIDVLGLWWPMEHEEFVREAMDKIRGDLPCLKDDAIYNTVVKRVVEGNAHMDALKPYKNPDANNLPLHYNRAMCQDYNKAKEIYREGLKQRRDNISSNDLGTEAKCYEALEQMGQLTHMLQDYYGHGVDESYVYQGSKISAGFGGVMFLTTEWAGKIGNSYGNPDSCENQMKPSSYSRWYLGSEHGSLFDGEPAWRAPDTSARRNSSIEVSVNELLLHMKSWCNKCCPQSNLQQLPIPTPSMIDVYNAIVEISL